MKPGRGILAALVLALVSAPAAAQLSRGAAEGLFQRRDGSNTLEGAVLPTAAAANAGRLFYLTPPGTLYLDVGGVWVNTSLIGGAASWGTITGTLSAQTDLQAALDAKLNLTGGTMTGNVLWGSDAVYNIGAKANTAAAVFLQTIYFRGPLNVTPFPQVILEAPDVGVDTLVLMPGTAGTLALLSDIPAETDPLALHVDGSTDMAGTFTWSADNTFDVGAFDYAGTLTGNRPAWAYLRGVSMDDFWGYPGQALTFALRNHDDWGSPTPAASYDGPDLTIRAGFAQDGTGDALAKKGGDVFIQSGDGVNLGAGASGGNVDIVTGTGDGKAARVLLQADKILLGDTDPAATATTVDALDNSKPITILNLQEMKSPGGSGNPGATSCFRLNADDLRYQDSGAGNHFVAFADDFVDFEEIQLADSGALGTCNAAAEGTIRLVKGGAGVQSKFWGCLKNAADAFTWEQVAP